MNCPHCLVEFHPERKFIYVTADINGQWATEIYRCPNPKCSKAIIYLLNGEFFKTGNGEWNVANDSYREIINKRELIKPKGISRYPVPKEVPIELSQDYTEACLVLADSPKASAALSRRCLQHLLRDAGKVKPNDLAKEIQEVLDSNKLPSHIAESIDAIRNIGNFATHPLKSTSTGEIVEVEPGESEWTLEVLEMLFDFYYVQPVKTKERREALNKKLGDAGKPVMKN